MKQNEFIPHETFAQFVSRKLNKRTGKRVVFPESSYNINKREVLDTYLTAMRDKEKDKLES